MPKQIKADELASTVKEYLNAYSDECLETVDEVVTRVTKESAKELKGKSIGGFQDRTGKYRKGWKSKVDKGRLSTEGVVYNGAMPGLTHLLEFGHAKQGGGRTRAFPHIAEVNDEAQEKVEQELMKKL